MMMAVCALSACAPVLPQEPATLAAMNERERMWYEAMGTALASKNT